MGMEKFIARKEEISRISSALSSDHFELILVYGRRHVGKTELIRHCLNQFEGRKIYYMCRQVREKQLTDDLRDAIHSVTDLSGQYFRSFSDSLRYLFELGTIEPLTVVLDEYPNARQMIEGLDSTLQSLADEYKFRSGIKLILSGSYIDVMKSLKSKKAPLYGRITLSIDLKQMDYYDSSLFYPSFTEEEKVALYSVFGGMPLYNSLIREDLSVKDNIISLIASKNARLEDEIDMFLKTELSKIENANSLFTAMAAGIRQYNEIMEAADISSTGVMSELIKKLTGMEAVRKEFPINKENDKTKSRYFINDNLAQFYFKYIASHQSALQIMNSDAFFKRFIESDFYEHFVPKAFEDICRQYLIRMNLNGNIDPVIEKIGKFYYDNPSEHKNGEFDIVTLDEKGYVFYEAKFKSQPVTSGMIQKEILQVNATTLNCYKYGFFSKSGYKGKIPNDIIRYTIQDLYTAG
jgi:AAA+ ATPase superfamily predicted ATPase